MKIASSHPSMTGKKLASRGTAGIGDMVPEQVRADR
jgi:hypothetical protein